MPALHPSVHIMPILAGNLLSNLHNAMSPSYALTHSVFHLVYTAWRSFQSVRHSFHYVYHLLSISRLLLALFVHLFSIAPSAAHLPLGLTTDIVLKTDSSCFGLLFLLQ